MTFSIIAMSMSTRLDITSMFTRPDLMNALLSILLACSGTCLKRTGLYEGPCRQLWGLGALFKAI